MTEDAKLPESIEEALAVLEETAREGWSYASPYFQDKWDATERLNKEPAALRTAILAELAPRSRSSSRM